MKKKYLSTICSALIWGSGQLINKQPVKAVIFFLVQAITLLNFKTFAHGIWGIVTLGEKAMVIKGNKVTPGDNSVILMIQGIIILLVLAIILLIYIWNVRDAYKTAVLEEKGGKIPTSLEYLKLLWSNAFEYIMITPALIFIVFLTLMPIFFGFLIAFTNYASPKHLPPRHLIDWVGLYNFKQLFRSPIWGSTFSGVFLWTVIWAVLSTVTCFFGGLFQAVIVNSKRVKIKKLWRTIYILPWAIPGMISLLVFRNLFNGQFGPINAALKSFGLIDHNIPWLSDPMVAKLTILIVNVWLGFPYFMALMTGIMTGISKELYEAAQIDGATPVDEFRHITFPLVLYSTMPLLIMSFAGNFNNFTVIYFLTEGGPANPKYQFAGSTDILITWIYKITMDNKQYAMASVMSMIIFMIIGTLSAYNFSRTKAFKEEDMM